MIHVALQDRQLWKEFDTLCNEMIITKIGRNLFPIIEYAFKGLQEHVEYQVGVTMQLTNCQKLKFTAGKWDPLDVPEEVFQPNEIFMAKPKSGRELMQRGLKLDKLKLTNTKEAVVKNDQMIRVQSMRQYIPVLHIYEVVATGVRLVGKYEFAETKFVAVTAYQSERVKQLKVQRNKFAQGFREGIRGGATSSKRPASTTSSTSPDSTLDSPKSDESPSGSKKMREVLEETSQIYSPLANPSEPFPAFHNFHFDPNWPVNWHTNYPYQHHHPSQFLAPPPMSENFAPPYDYTASFGGNHYPWHSQ
uniref:T-box domain-containing protein n=1 Tax=Caenorhabditis japonica TaxID=281687 RepID=A0A8R1I4H5_CAEJA